MKKKEVVSFRPHDRVVVVRSDGAATPIVMDLERARQLHQGLTVILREQGLLTSES